LKKIPLIPNGEALVDDYDWDMLHCYEWHLRVERHTSYAYRHGAGSEQSYFGMHSAIMLPPTGYVVHHINRNGLDNRRDNLSMMSRSVHAGLSVGGGRPTAKARKVIDPDGNDAVQTSLVAKRLLTEMAAQDGVPRSVFVHRLAFDEYERRQEEKADDSDSQRHSGDTGEQLPDVRPAE